MSDQAETTNKKGSNAIIIALWAAMLLVVFVAFRSTDLLRLPSLIGDLGGGALIGSGIVDSFAGAVIAVIIFLSWFGLGTFVAGFIHTERKDGDSHVLELARNAAVGAILWSLVWFFLGLFGVYNSAAAISVTIIGVILAAFGLTRIRSAKAESRTPDPATGIDKVFLLAIAFCLGISFIASLAPPIAKDTLLYHFAVPKAFIAQHSSAFIEGNIASYLALGTEMHVVWAMLLGNLFGSRAGEAAAGASVFLFLPLLLAVVFGWCRQLQISRTWSLMAVLMIAAVPTIFHVASSGYIDLALALYSALAVHSLDRFLDNGGSAHLVLIAIFLGGALAVKLTAVFVIAGIVLALLLRSRNSENALGIILSVLLAIVFAGVLASPWYVRNWTATGSPVFPFYMNVWKGSAPGWDVERSDLFQMMNSQYGGAAAHPENYLIAPLRFSLSAQPEDPNLYDGVLGAAFLMGLPLLFWAIWKGKANAEVLSIVAVSLVIYLFWLFTSQQLRYLLPIIPLISISIAFAAGKVADDRSNKAWLFSFAAASLLGMMTMLSWFCIKAPLRVVLGGEARDQYLSRNLDHYPFYLTLADKTQPDEKTWLINMRRDTYTIDRPVVSDYLFEDVTLKKFLWESHSIEELRQKAASLGVRYVLARHDFLFDYDRSSLVDDKRPKAENEAKLGIAKSFLLDPSRVIKADDKFSLVKVN